MIEKVVTIKNSDDKNAVRILKALDEFGFGSVGLKEEDIKTPNKVIQLGYPPVRIDIITSISGVSWDEAIKNHSKGKYGDTPVLYIGKEHYKTGVRMFEKPDLPLTEY